MHRDEPRRFAFDLCHWVDSNLENPNMNTLSDSLGHAVSGATGAAIEHHEQAAHQLRCLIGDPLSTIDRAIAEAPGMSIAHTGAGHRSRCGTSRGAPCRNRSRAFACTCRRACRRRPLA
jgi:hypothetical protein